MKSKRNASSANAGTQDQNERKKFSFDYTLEGHTFAASCVAFSMFGVKGKYIISGGNDRLVKVWDWSRYLDATQTSSNSDLLHLSISLSMKVEEREIVETCYRKGLVRVLIATSTLDAGVNLPPRRVMFRQPWIGRDFIDGTRYRQMAGRASRTGIDTKGESVLLCKPEDVKRIMGILNDSCPPLHSCLSEDKNGMTHAILEVVASGIVQTANDIHRYVRCTLLNSTKPFEDVAKSAQDSLRWLCHRKFIEWSEDTKLYSTTPLGRASFGSSLCPEESLIILDDLSRAREGFVLASDLHLVYLVERFMQLFTLDQRSDFKCGNFVMISLSLDHQSVGKQVGVLEPFLMRMAHGAPLHTSNRSRDNAKGLLGRSDCRVGMANQSMLSDEQTLRVCKRFYVAIILSRLVQEVLVAEVCEAFKVARGMVQASQENAGRFASMVSVFCERLGWHDLEGLVSKFQNRVSFGVRVEIVELTAIPYVKGSRARQLYKAGLRTPQAIAVASISEIVKALFESSSWVAQAQRRIQLVHAKLFLIKLKRQGLLPSQLSNLLDLMFPSYLNLY
ncbi:helicase and polymerase-containing protein TEBICHI-like isoform X2 [Camellia sinensis]|uniref:helicase and polymerase-containing protein TEBICHI-like isoform X2 n=1 Tax=Camellia sinensis TaxID=4442 RepID=UPI0010366DEB|nr:helicase and polymerase-containing protein TEBICHI-like isoform X2 [Camellia sinensis]